MMISIKALATIFFVATARLPQGDSRIAAKVETVVFPALPRQARIQGDVRLRSGPEGVTLLSGNPLLAPVAVENLKDIATEGGLEGEVVYHFVFGGTGTVLKRTTEKKGNAFSRFFLRLLGMKTERVVEYAECVPGPVPKNKIDRAKTPVEIWIYGPGACVDID